MEFSVQKYLDASIFNNRKSTDSNTLKTLYTIVSLLFNINATRLSCLPLNGPAMIVTFQDENLVQPVCRGI